MTTETKADKHGEPDRSRGVEGSMNAEMERRWNEVKDRPLSYGAHEPDGQMCVMEMTAYIAGEPWSDHPQCVSPVIAEFLRVWNDGMNDNDRQMLKPYAARVIGTRASSEIENQRAWMALDWQCRVSAAGWLRAAKLTDAAAELEALAPITDTASAQAAQATLNKARAQAAAARAAAWDAAGAAARDAARAAAWDAARAAAWDAAGAAARDAARDAAWDAAGAAAWAAAGAAARAALRPTVENLQHSALELLDRMIAVYRAEAE